MQRQMAHGAQVAHTAAVRTSGADLAENSRGNTSGSAGGMSQGRTKRSGKPTGKRMSSAERQRCYDNELCFFCKKSGHVSRECPEERPARETKGPGGGEHSACSSDASAIRPQTLSRECAREWRAESDTTIRLRWQYNRSAITAATTAAAAAGTTASTTRRRGSALGRCAAGAFSSNA